MPNQFPTEKTDAELLAECEAELATHYEAQADIEGDIDCCENSIRILKARLANKV
jgi:hypothetical protein